MSYAFLQVGINEYSGAPLRGCLNDCLNLYRHFNTFGLYPAREKSFFNHDATRANILNGLRWLIDQDASTLIFQYSGHGTRVRDRNGDETSKYDSAICPVDYWVSGVILDDELASIYNTVPLNKRLIVLSDSCYSGKSQRMLWKRMRRALFNSHMPRFMPSNFIREPQVTAATIKLTRRKTFLETNERCVLISTSKETQTSADAHIDGQWQGAGTAALLWAWAQCGLNASYEAVSAYANAWLSRHDYPQVLRVEAKADNRGRALFT